MSRIYLAIPGDPETRTGGYAYDRALLARLPEQGVHLEYMQLPDGFPFPSPGAIAETLRSLHALSADDICLVDGLAFGVLPAEDLSRCRARLAALVHHPLCLETGLAPDTSMFLRDNERAALARAKHVIVTSQFTRELLIAEFGIAATDITVAIPGVTRRPRAAGSKSAVCQLLAVGSVVQRKGYEGLVLALSGMRDLSWQLTIAGSLDREPETASRVRALIRLHDLEGRVVLTGEIDDDRLAEAYAGSDLFVLASHYEGYGMVLAEAMACGLPIVTTTGGASGDTVPDGAALKVQGDDPEGLRNALRCAVPDPQLRSQLAEASWNAGQRLPDWSATARLVASALRNIGRRDG